MAAATGMLSRLSINGIIFDFESCSLGVQEAIVDANGLRGSLAHDVSRFRQGIRRVGGQIRLQPNVEETPLLNTFAMGGAASTLSNTALVYAIVHDKVAKVGTYTSSAVNRSTWSANQGEPMSMNLDILCIDESIGSSFGSPTAMDAASGPWMFQELGLSISSSTFSARNFSMVLDNHLDSGRFFNSQTLISLVRTDRTITVQTELPYGDANAVYNTGSAGASIVATFTNAVTSNTMTFTLGKVVFGRTPIAVPGRTEVMYSLVGQAAANGATAELVVAYGP